MSSVRICVLFSGRKEKLLRAFTWLNLIHLFIAWNKIPTEIHILFICQQQVVSFFEIPLYGFVIKSCVYFFFQNGIFFSLNLSSYYLKCRSWLLAADCSRAGLLQSPFPWTQSFESEATFLPHTGLWFLPCSRAPHLESQLSITVPWIWKERLRLCPHSLLLCMWACPQLEDLAHSQWSSFLGPKQFQACISAFS